MLSRLTQSSDHPRKFVENCRSLIKNPRGLNPETHTRIQRFPRGSRYLVVKELKLEDHTYHGFLDLILKRKQ